MASFKDSGLLLKVVILRVCYIPIHTCPIAYLFTPPLFFFFLFLPLSLYPIPFVPLFSFLPPCRPGDLPRGRRRV